MSSFLLPNAAFLAGGALEEAIANTSDGLLTGEIIPLVGNTQKSPDFMEFLKILDKNNRGRTPSGSYWIATLPTSQKKHSGFLIRYRTESLNLYSRQNTGRG